MLHKMEVGQEKWIQKREYFLLLRNTKKMIPSAYSNYELMKIKGVLTKQNRGCSTDLNILQCMSTESHILEPRPTQSRSLIALNIQI